MGAGGWCDSVLYSPGSAVALLYIVQILLKKYFVYFQQSNYVTGIHSGRNMPCKLQLSWTVMS